MILKDLKIPKAIIKEAGWKESDRLTIDTYDMLNEKTKILCKVLVIKKEKK